MKHLFSILLAFSLFAGTSGLGQDRPRLVSLIQLIANPEQFDGTLVSAQGYLVRVGGDHDITAHFLYLHKEDADNQLGNSILVVANDQMRRDQEKIDHMYVRLIGTFRAVPAANGSYAAEISHVQTCIPWSDPSRPIGLKADDKKSK
jgi:hypothetical protein